MGIVSFSVIHYIPSCRGGGIPTAVAILRGHIPFEWMTTLVGMFSSSIITFGIGVPLGNEGPSVQMGTAIGRGSVFTLAKKHNKTIIASHSNSYSVCNHKRNLRDDDFIAICDIMRRAYGTVVALSGTSGEA